MPHYVTLLRGVNVGGHGKLPMADFRKMLADLGYGAVKSYIQSGNATFTSDDAARDIARAVSDGIHERFGFRRPVIVRSLPEFQQAIRASPFTPAEGKKLHLIFTQGDITLDARGLQALCTAGEEFALIGSTLYLHTPHGFGTSKAAAKLEKFLQAEAFTARNLTSCHAIAALAAAP